MLGLTLRNLFASKFRLLSTSLSILIGVAFLAGSMVLIDTLGDSFDDLVTELGADTDVIVRNPDVVEADFNQVRGTIDESLLEVVRNVDGVALAEPGVEGFAQLVDKNGEAIGNPAQGAPSLGFNWVPEGPMNPMTISDGRGPEQPGEILIDRATAKNNDLGVGDRVTVLLQVPPEEFEIVGIAGFGDNDSILGASATLFDLETAQRVLSTPGRLNQIGIHADPDVSQEELVTRVAAVVGPNVEVISGQQSTDEFQSDISDALSFFNTFMTIFSLIALFVASFIIYNTFSILVAQRVKETALLRSLGARRGQVLASVGVEAVVVGLIASLVGVAAGVGVAELLKQMMGSLGFDIPADGVVLTLSTVYTALIAGVMLTVFSALIPAVRASRVSPMAALRDAAVDDSALSRSRMTFGALLLSAGLAVLFLGLFVDVPQRLALVGVGAAAVFLGVAGLGPVMARPFSRVVGLPIAKFRGLPGELARENGMRNPKRTATTAAALMVGVGLVSAVSIFASSTTKSVDKIIDDTVVGDLVIDGGSQGFGGLSPELAQDVDALPEVQVATGVRMVLAEVDGTAQTLLAFDTEIMNQVGDVKVVSGSTSDLGLTGLAIHEDLAKDKGWGIGTSVPVRFPDSGEQNLTVGAIYAEDAMVGSVFISTEAHQANSNQVFDLAVYVLSNPDVPIEDVRAAVEGLTAEYPNATVQNLTELKESIHEDVNQMLSLVYALLALAVVIALIGIANTLALSIVERTREIGLLRAVGMTRSQVRATVRWESLLIALMGVSLGLATGLFFGWSMVEALSGQGITEFSVPLNQIAVVAVIAAIAGVGASLRPASRAAKLPILDAVVSE